MDVHGFIDISCDFLWFPADNGEAVQADWVSCWVVMVVDGERGPKMLVEPVPRCSTGFSNVFFGAGYVRAFKFVDYSTLLKFVALSLGSMSRIL